MDTFLLSPLSLCLCLFLSLSLSLCLSPSLSCHCGYWKINLNFLLVLVQSSFYLLLLDEPKLVCIIMSWFVLLWTVCKEPLILFAQFVLPVQKINWSKEKKKKKNQFVIIGVNILSLRSICVSCSRLQLQSPGHYSALEAFYEDKRALLPPSGDGVITACPANAWGAAINHSMHPEMKVGGTFPSTAVSASVTGKIRVLLLLLF